ncbi:MAG: glycosyltransferase [Desulfovibrio sp.]|jgi:glycosyltransferase involved in cell wall biosynthesis|nr:glycosyltransferase [Desulfovibrio sp.]
MPDSPLPAEDAAKPEAGEGLEPPLTANAAAKKTVCLCNSALAWGGGEKWHLDAALALAGRGWRVFLLCHPRGALYARAAERSEGVRIVPLPLGRLSFLNPLCLRRLLRFFRNTRPGAVILNLPADLKAAGPAARAAGVPRIIFRRGSALPVRNSACNRFLYGRVITRLIVNSEGTRRMVFRNNSRLLPSERVSLLPNGLDPQAFDQALARCDLALEAGTGAGPLADLARLSWTVRPLVLGTAGRLNRQKGQHLFLRLGRRLLDAGLDCRLVLAGSGEREAELRAMAWELDLGEKVVFAGFQEDLSCFWRAIDLFVLTSLWEGFGFVLLEAMLAQKPILAYRVSNIPELVNNGVNGLLFPLPEGENAPDAHPPAAGGAIFPAKGDMAAGVLELSRDVPRRRAMGRAGREFALAGFSQSACMDRLEDLLTR